ncbi:hypothetical protein CK203_105106 [Vitis vinifera]|uniref:Transposon Ty3-I Gag-Pol polyprotein n=1 Tax=Vitis vinifera TaxID=29760 RepID=A0A438CNQ6_VITVI|nr:hypothetical protein CK203_105106 [Vitis vinifera]
MLSFLDAFSGYHQIPMSPADEEKTAFITPHDLYCYKSCHSDSKTLAPLIKTDDKDLQTSDRPHGRALANSWVYGQPKRHRGQPGSSQGSHRNTTTQEQEGVQRLTGKLVALGRFIARFTDELRPSSWQYEKLENGWTDNLGNQRCSIPLPLTQGAETYLLRQQSIGGRRNQVFKNGANSLSPSKRCPKLRPYFQAHPVVVLTDQPLRNILHKPDLTGRMLQWAIELSEFGIEFQPRLSMKGQVMADFVLEYSRRPSQRQESSEKEWWTLRVDGASRSSGSGVGLLLQSPTGNTWSKPSGWDSLPPTMKQNMRPSYPDWTSLWLYPSPSSGSIAIRNS